MGRTIAPIAAVARPVSPQNRPPTVIVARRTIRIRSPTAPIAVIVIGAARSPVPSPSTPSPRLVVYQQRANSDSDSKTDQRRCHDRTGGRSNVNHGGIVSRHINHLRARRLDYINCLARRLLHLYSLLRIASQRPGRIGLSSQPLNRVGHSRLISRERLTDRGVVVDVLRHHRQHLRKIRQRDKRGIESLSLRCVG